MDVVLTSAFIVGIGILIMLFITSCDSAVAAPAWCSYPDDTVALANAVDARVADIARYSPGQSVDRFTLQLDLMTRCSQ